MKSFSISHYVKFTCWTSIVLILWGVTAGVIEHDWETWFAFAFFCIVGLLAFIATWNDPK